MLGLSLATAIGSPLGVFLAPSIGWRNILLVIALLSACVALAIGSLFPHLDRSSPLSLRDRVRPLGTRRVALILGSTFLVLTGLYVTYTYSSVVFGKATDYQPHNLALLLAIWGIAGTVGSVLGRTADRFGDRTIVNVALAALVLDFCFIYVAGTTFYGAVVGIAIWGVCGWAFADPAAAPAHFSCTSSCAGPNRLAPYCSLWRHLFVGRHWRRRTTTSAANDVDSL